WQIDATQLKRNAFIVAATAVWLANAGAAEGAELAPFVAARGLERLARDAATASAILRGAAGGAAGRARAARKLLESSVEREDATLASIAGPAPRDSALAAGPEAGGPARR